MFYLIVSIMIYYTTEIAIFSSLSGVSFPIWKKGFILALAFFMNQNRLLSPLLLDPLIFLVVLAMAKQPLWRLKSFFLAFFPAFFSDLTSRFMIAVVIPYFCSDCMKMIESGLMTMIAYALVYPSFLLTNYFIGKDYQTIVQSENGQKSQQFYMVYLICILVYYVDILVVLGFADPFMRFSHLMVVFPSYKMLFLIFMLLFALLFSYFNRAARHILEEKLLTEQVTYIGHLESYGVELEKLYKDIENFKKSYLSRLDQLGATIACGSIKEIQALYYDSVGNAAEYWDNKHYNLAKLSNVHLSSIKSILSAKIIEAEKAGISVHLEVPDIITHTSIAPLDLVLLIAIFCDNAIEAAVLSEARELSIAYFNNAEVQMLVVANSIKEERVNIVEIFKEGYSSKGKVRGIGLSNVQAILKKYPRLSLSTKSACYEFRQTLVIGPEVEGESRAFH